jgi:hypothetical protein
MTTQFDANMIPNLNDDANMLQFFINYGLVFIDNKNKPILSPFLMYGKSAYSLKNTILYHLEISGYTIPIKIAKCFNLPTNEQLAASINTLQVVIQEHVNHIITKFTEKKTDSKGNAVAVTIDKKNKTCTITNLKDTYVRNDLAYVLQVYGGYSVYGHNGKEYSIVSNINTQVVLTDIDKFLSTSI